MFADLRSSRLLVPATVFLVVGGLFSTLWRVVSDQARSEFELRSHLTSEQVAIRIEEKVTVCLQVIHQLTEDWDGDQIPSQQAFKTRVHSILRNFPGIVSVDLVADSGEIVWAVPGERDRALLPRRVNANPPARSAFRTSGLTDAVSATPIIDLQDNVRGFAAYFPLNGGGNLSIGATVLAETLIEDSLSESLKRSFRWVVYDGDEPIYDSRAEAPESAFTTVVPIQVADRQWTVALAPIPSLTEALQQFGTHLILVLGLLVAVGLTVVSARLISSQERLRDNEERLRAVAEHIPGVVYSYETSPGKPRELIYLGPGLESIIGPRMTARVEQKFDVLFELMHPADLARVTTLADRGSASGDMVDCEARLMTDDGSYRWVRSLSRPLAVDRNRTRWHIVLIDIAEHRRIVDALRESEERYRLLVESSPVGVLIHRHSIFQFVNPAAAKLLGYNRPEALIGNNIDTIIPPEDRAMVQERIERLDAESEPLRYGDERLRRRDGTDVDVELIVSTINFGGGPARQVLILDITEQRLAEQRQRLLMQELDHRVKNNLASVLALLDQTAASTSHIDEFRAKFANRIKAMARTHEMLARTKWSGVRMSDIIRLSLAPHIVEESDRIRIDGPSLLVRPRPAMPVGLALHELATNALKYGSLSNSDGRIDIRWTRENGSITIQWSESGGPPASSPEDLGMGLRLVRGLVEFELGGNARFDFASGSLICTLRIDAETLTEEPA